MRLLIIEDEKKTASYLHKGLAENGFVVDVAHNGTDGLLLATTHLYDLIVLDIMLPQLDGWGVLKEIRRQQLDVRILFLTAYSEVESKVKALELGADDYLVKPFAFSELLARVRSLLRRSTKPASENICIADLQLDSVRRRATRNAIRLDLTAKEFTLLEFLMRRTGEVLSRTLIAECVWDIHFDSDTNTIDVAIRRLRQKVDDPFEKKLIHTIRGMGYVLEER